MKKPYITLKFAQTLDGKIAAKDGSSRWISNPASRKFAHKLRTSNDAVLIGAGTVINDDPLLSARLVKGKNPIRVVIDGNLRIPTSSKIVKTAKQIKTLIVTSPASPRRKIEALSKKGAGFVFLSPSEGGNIDIRRIILILYKIGIRKLLVEGGRKIITAFIKEKLADRIIIIIAPKMLGEGIESVGNMGIGNIKEALRLNLESVKRLDGDVIYTASLKRQKKG